MDETKVQIGEEVLLDIGIHSEWYISSTGYDGESVDIKLRKKADRIQMWCFSEELSPDGKPYGLALQSSDGRAVDLVPAPKWIPCSERLPSEEERKEWIDNNLDGIGYLYPCLVTRYSSINPDRTKNNPYVAKHYFDGEDFVNCGEEVCSEYILAWMPLPAPWKGADDDSDNV